MGRLKRVDARRQDQQESLELLTEFARVLVQHKLRAESVGIGLPRFGKKQELQPNPMLTAESKSKTLQVVLFAMCLVLLTGALTALADDAKPDDKKVEAKPEP